jgi:hypothetical protein
VKADLIRKNPDPPPAPSFPSQDAPVLDVTIEHGRPGTSKLPKNLEEHPTVRREEVLSRRELGPGLA